MGGGSGCNLWVRGSFSHAGMGGGGNVALRQGINHQAQGIAF